jgi:peroxiredoxin
MRSTTCVSVLAVCFGFVFLVAGCDRPPQSAKKSASKKQSTEQGTPKADEILRRMADYLGELPAFSCSIDALMRIQAQGMDNRVATKFTLRLERPNRFALVVDEGEMGTTIISDGKQLIQFLPMTNRYTVQEAPDDLAGLAKEGGAMGLSSMSNVIIPTSGEEFFDKLMANVKRSEYLGAEKIGEVICHHCRFYRDDFNWDIWIESGERPLVHKVVPDLSKQLAEAGEVLKDAKLEYSIAFANWNVAPKFTDADFAFTPPEGAEEVESLMAGMGGAGAPEDELHGLVGQPAPPFQTVDPDGQPIDLAAHLGKQVIMLDFWATWCGPCIDAMPEVDGVAEKFAESGLVFYAVNSGEDADTVKEFLKSAKLELPVAMDTDGKVNELYLVNGIPQTVLIGKDGKVQVVHVGFSENLGELLTKEVEELLAGKDLASEAQAKAAKAAEKRSARRGKVAVDPVGVAEAWTLPGQFDSVAVDAATNAVYAASPKGIATVNAAGELQQEVSAAGGDNLRLANLAGDAAPEMIRFRGWGPSVSAHNAAGEPLWDYSLGDGVDDVWPVDLDGDAMEEVIVGYNGGTGLHVLDQRGNPLWKFTEIGNVWHVTAGDFNNDGKPEVVTTSARGDLHVFNSTGEKAKDIDVSIYASMVRMAKLGDGPTLAIVCGSGDGGERMIAVNFEGEEKWALDLPHLDVDHTDDLAISAAPPWAAVAMRGGLVHVVDLDSARIVARAAGQGMRPQVAWLARKDQTPLLLVATGSGLNAFEISPVDVDSDVTEVEPSAAERESATSNAATATPANSDNGSGDQGPAEAAEANE